MAQYSRIDHVKFFKGCLPQIFLGPFLNTLSRIIFMAVFLKKVLTKILRFLESLSYYWLLLIVSVYWELKFRMFATFCTTGI